MNTEYLKYFLETELNASTRDLLIRDLVENDWIDEEDTDDIKNVVNALSDYLYNQFEYECREIYLHGISIDALFDK